MVLYDQLAQKLRTVCVLVYYKTVYTTRIPHNCHDIIDVIGALPAVVVRVNTFDTMTVEITRLRIATSSTLGRN